MLIGITNRDLGPVNRELYGLQGTVIRIAVIRIRPRRDNDLIRDVIHRYTV